MRRHIFHVQTEQYSTLYKIANVLYSSQDKQQGPCPSLHIILIPGGTGNALHSTFFPPQSSSASSITEPTLLALLLSFLSVTPCLVPLTFTYISMSISLPVPPNNKKSEGSPTLASSNDVISIVVTLTALHAAILHDSEVLHTVHPCQEPSALSLLQHKMVQCGIRPTYTFLPPYNGKMSMLMLLSLSLGKRIHSSSKAPLCTSSQLSMLTTLSHCSKLYHCSVPFHCHLMC